MSYLNLLQICLPFQVLSSFGVVKCHEMTNHIWHRKSEPISTILVDLFCSRIMTNILTWMDTLRINVAECLVSKSDLPFPSVGRKWDVELEQQSDTWERVVTLSTAVRRKVALVFPLNSAVTCQAFLSVNFFFFCWNYSLGLLSPLIWLKNNFFLLHWQLGGQGWYLQFSNSFWNSIFQTTWRNKRSQWVVSCVSLFFSYFQHGKRKTKAICHGLGSPKFWASAFSIFRPHSQA